MYVAAIARAGIAAGADGLIIEVHPDPAKAVSDGKQSQARSLCRHGQAGRPNRTNYGTQTRDNSGRCATVEAGIGGVRQ
ncbi:MAG: hypothetical protein U0Z26_06920 [Anaerolineales bacterium]